MTITDGVTAGTGGTSAPVPAGASAPVPAGAVAGSAGVVAGSAGVIAGTGGVIPGEVVAPGEAAPVAIQLHGVSKVYRTAAGAMAALDRVSLSVAQGEFVCLVGASGCGKSTLLNLIAGLDQPSQGRIDRPGGAVAMMFQDAALFPWLTVAANVELALRLGSDLGRAARGARVAELLELVHLGGFGARRPHELSGGMRQRAALARALAQDARVLLMDEPFGALDAITRDLLHDELERVWHDTRMTVVFVTHNVREAVRLGDRVVLLTSRPGRVAATYDIEAPRPRRIESPEVASAAAVIVDRLRQEVARHARG
ncbi:MAG TPA: ABC transporter ATP-binding protein [Acidimicrobiales bacterium]|jgi:NitT/TauT family transport system ATP-binding protein|nr:ABC transporter ATP-binding protein [Acidimicrobiales bacterium]